VLKKEQTLLYYIKSEFKNRILFIHVNQIAVPENHDKIVTSLRIAHAREYLLDKEQIIYDGHKSKLNRFPLSQLSTGELPNDL